MPRNGSSRRSAIELEVLGIKKRLETENETIIAKNIAGISYAVYFMMSNLFYTQNESL